jgi:glycosyltransferase involved in cell wall biosynthesis
MSGELYVERGEYSILNYLDIIVPCYNEYDCIKLFYTEVAEQMDAMKEYYYTVYFIDDGSLDDTLCVIKELAEKHGEERINIYPSLVISVKKRQFMLACKYRTATWSC